MKPPLRLGDRAERTRSFTAADAAALAALGGAAAAPGCVPEALIGALFSQLLGVDLPGPGTNYIKQETDYLAPAPLDAPLTASVEVVKLRGDKGLVDLETLCRDAGGVLIASGRAVVLVTDVGCNEIPSFPVHLDKSGEPSPQNGPTEASMLKILVCVAAIASAVSFVVTHPTSAEIADLSTPAAQVAR